MHASQVLGYAKALIQTEETWCQGSFAMRADGQPTTCNDELATQFCATGAIHKICYENLPGWHNDIISYSPVRLNLEAYMDECMAQAAEEVIESHRITAEMTGDKDLLPEYVNDNLDHENVMKMFDRAIEIARKGEAV